MAFKLTKAEKAQREKLLDSLREAWAPYCAVANEVKAFTTSVAERAQEEYDEKFEKWQESEKADAARDWISSWEEAVEFDDDGDNDVMTELKDLPEEAE